MDLTHNTGHLKSLQSFAFAFPALDPYKHFIGASSEASDLHLERGHSIPLCSRVKYYFNITLMTNLTQSD